MEIISYFQSDRQSHWLKQIEQYEWRAAQFLAHLLRTGEFHQRFSPAALYLLTDGDHLVSFLTLAVRDEIDDPTLYPWIGFVHTAPEYRGHGHIGKLIEHAVQIAADHGMKQVYLTTDHTGLYERYGFAFLEHRQSDNEIARLYVRRWK